MRLDRKMIFLAITVFITACQADDAPSMEELTPGIMAGELPLLAGTNRIGMIEGFNISNPQATRDSIVAKWSEAKNSGMTVGRLQLDWSELEPAPNTYDRPSLQSRLENLNAQGLQPFLLLSAYDSDGPTVPTDLEGIRFNDERLIDRFKGLLNWVVPLLIENGGWALSISNEPDNSFRELPTLSSDIKSFARAIRDHVHTISPKMAVTVTFAEGNLASHSNEIAAVLDECDIACWNFYGSFLDTENLTYAAKSVEEIRSSLKAVLGLSGIKKSIIQELGMHIGLDSSEEIQRLFYQTFFEQMETESQLEAAFAFQLVDWSPDTIDFYTASFDTESFPPGLLDAFSESLATIGLLDQRNGQARPAWNELMLWTTRFQ